MACFINFAPGFLLVCSVSVVKVSAAVFFFVFFFLLVYHGLIAAMILLVTSVRA